MNMLKRQKHNFHITISLRTVLFKNLSLSYSRYCHSATQDTPNLSWNTRANFCVHKCLPLDRILRHTNPIHAPIINFSNVHFGIILPPLAISSKCSLLSGIMTNILNALISLLYVAYPTPH